jgi:hypothetical protein
MNNQDHQTASGPCADSDAGTAQKPSWRARVRKHFADAAVRLSSYVNRMYKPAILFERGEDVSASARADYAEALKVGETVTAEMFKALPRSRHGQAVENVLGVAGKLGKVLGNGDPDAIASELVNLFCVGMDGMDVLDNQRRLVTVWSAVLAPNVVLREKEKRALAIEDIVEAGFDWIQFGFTQAARATYSSSDTRFISAHPARAYQLVAESAQNFQMDHGQLMLSMIMPVVRGIGFHRGATMAIDREHGKESGRKAKEAKAS